MFAKLFIDSGGFIAIADNRDDFHEAAVAFYRSISPVVRRFTSLLVISESFTWIRYNLGTAKAREWFTLIEEAEQQGLISLFYPNLLHDRMARRIIYRYDDQSFS